MPRYIDPRTDFGFKRLFGQEDSKDILKQFLFDVLVLPYPIQELTYIPVERLPASPQERRGIYDVYCTDTMGRHFIVEMQKADQENIKERALYYSTFAITYQSQRGADWQFRLLPVYCIAILDFMMIADDPRHCRRIELLDTETKTNFYDKLTFVFIELTKFKLELADDLSPADKWIYLLKRMPELQNIPAELASEPFQKVFAISEEAALSQEERWLYEGSLKQARVFNASLSAAHNAGMAEGMAAGMAEGMAAGMAEGMAEGMATGIAEGRRNRDLEIARAMLVQGMPLATIMTITGLTEADLATLQ